MRMSWFKSMILTLTILTMMGTTLGMSTKTTPKMNGKTPTSLTCEQSCPYRRFAWAIAKAEGFFIRGSIPARNHNPGDLKAVKGYRFPGQVNTDRFGHIRFRSDNDGWAALENQVRVMCSATGRYSPGMTISQVGRTYAKNSRRWSALVSKNLGCADSVTLAQLLDIPPAPVPPVIQGDPMPTSSSTIFLPTLRRRTE